MTDSAIIEQKRVVLTAHPFQRVGAFSLCAIARVQTPEDLTVGQFDAAVDTMTTDAVRAGQATDTKAEDGFWLKASGSLFPNSKMNHPSRVSKLDRVGDEIREWRKMPPAEAWPAAGCALCDRAAVGFYGKVDVALAESVAYRNTTPRGHGGLALCWPCLCCFYALPYGCVLTGGPSSVLHAFDDEFLSAQVFRQVRANERHITLGQPVNKSPLGFAGRALMRLRRYEGRLRSGVELMVFSNGNREQTLAVHSLDQPLAEWLRQSRLPNRSAGFAALVRAHRSRQAPGFAVLASNAFDNPARIIDRAARYASSIVDKTHAVPDDIMDLGQTCRDFAERVLCVNDDDIKQIETLAANLAIVISANTVRGPLTGLLRAAKDKGLLQSLLQTMSAKWLLSPPEGTTGPLVTTRQFRLLFDPDGQSWLNRQLLTIAVFQQLSERNWRPVDATAVADELDQEIQAQTDIDNDALNETDGDQA